MEIVSNVERLVVVISGQGIGPRGNGNSLCEFPCVQINDSDGTRAVITRNVISGKLAYIGTRPIL